MRMKQDQPPVAPVTQRDAAEARRQLTALACEPVAQVPQSCGYPADIAALPGANLVSGDAKPSQLSSEQRRDASLWGAQTRFPLQTS
jgi:hypothetical protein